MRTGELSKKGYVVFKNEFSSDIIEQTKDTLTIQPVQTINIPGQETDPFPIYLENDKKLYVPKHFGIRKFGPIQKNKIPEGKDIQVSFNGTLRKHQVDAIEHIQKGFKETGGGILSLACGQGKCLDLSTNVWTTQGIKQAQHLNIGDKLLNGNTRDGQTDYNVITKMYSGRDTMYYVWNDTCLPPFLMDKDTLPIVNREHLLHFKTECGDTLMRAEDYYTLQMDKSEMIYEWFGVQQSLYHTSSDLFDWKNMYQLGHFEKKGLCNYFEQTDFKKWKYTKCIEFGMSLLEHDNECNWFNKFSQFFGTTFVEEPSTDVCRLLWNIHIKDTDKVYGISLIERFCIWIGIQLGKLKTLYQTTTDKDDLSSLIETCMGFFVLYVANETLSMKLQFKKKYPIAYNWLNALEASLGIQSRLRSSKFLPLDDFIFHHLEDYYHNSSVTLFYAYGEDVLHFMKTFKSVVEDMSKEPEFCFELLRHGQETRVYLIPKNYGLYVGFECTGSHLFRFENNLITHNTTTALNVVSLIGKKTLVVVHKEFLMDQWRERIQFFLPNARIGTIQRNKVDVKDKDIVLGMLHSLSMKNYPIEVFEDFGLTIIDEVHYIATKVFSRSLPIINTRLMLGLSATPERKDGMSMIFYDTLGPILFVKRRDSKDDMVLVKTLHLYSTSPLYKPATFFNGRTNTPKMITNMSEYFNRTMFLLIIIHWIFSLNENKRKILIFSDRRDHLKFMEKCINEMSIYHKQDKITTGLYIGRNQENKARHQEKLKQNEKKDVILATYKMAKDGLDIPSLNTLIMATPISDVEQACGRILRDSGNGIRPLIIDLVDHTGSFVNQYVQRKRFYRGEKYDVQEVHIDIYHQVSTFIKLQTNTPFDNGMKPQVEINPDYDMPKKNNIVEWMKGEENSERMKDLLIRPKKRINAKECVSFFTSPFSYVPDTPYGKTFYYSEYTPTPVEIEEEEQELLGNPMTIRSNAFSFKTPF